jgi:predicted methyltransferase
MRVIWMSISASFLSASTRQRAEGGVAAENPVPDDPHVKPVFDPAIRHRTDQVVLKFRKPRSN